MHGVDDLSAWHAIDTKFLSFGRSFRNIFMTLSADGFNLFSSFLSQWSTWPIFMVIYNLSLWMTTKYLFVILVIFILTKHSPNGGNIDVYMKSIIDHLKTLWWHGMWADDHNIPVELMRRFRFKRCLMWTINNRPRYGLISGMTYADYTGCPPCGPEVTSSNTRELHKYLYYGSRRWFHSRHHPYRRPTYSVTFENEMESRAQLKRPTTTKILERAAEYKIWPEVDNVVGGQLASSR